MGRRRKIKPHIEYSKFYKLGLQIRAKYSVPDVVKLTKWDGEEVHQLIAGKLQLTKEDLQHIKERLRIEPDVKQQEEQHDEEINTQREG